MQCILVREEDFMDNENSVVKIV